MLFGPEAIDQINNECNVQPGKRSTTTTTHILFQNKEKQN